MCPTASEYVVDGDTFAGCNGMLLEEFSMLCGSWSAPESEELWLDWAYMLVIIGQRWRWIE